MGFYTAANKVLIKMGANNATLVNIANNGSADIIANDDTDNQATAFNFTAGATGDDSIENFGRNDTILNYKKIFDGNGDGFIALGANGILDIDRSTKSNPGADQITLQGGVGGPDGILRYLGSTQEKDGVAAGAQHVYADATVLFDLQDNLGGYTVKEGSVGNNTLDGSAGATAFFYDTMLGLNLGGDTITGFGDDDLLVTTSLIYNNPASPSGLLITKGFNGVLDLSGEIENTPLPNGSGDVGGQNGGQIDLQGVTGVYLQNTVMGDGGVTYYYYGTQPAALEA